MPSTVGWPLWAAIAVGVLVGASAIAGVFVNYLNHRTSKSELDIKKLSTVIDQQQAWIVYLNTTSTSAINNITTLQHNINSITIVNGVYRRWIIEGHAWMLKVYDATIHPYPPPELPEGIDQL